jgi:predicted alternative tryptophan synthase beta-subunit
VNNLHTNAAVVTAITKLFDRIADLESAPESAHAREYYLDLYRQCRDEVTRERAISLTIHGLDAEF